MMKNLFAKHKALMTFLTMLAIAIIGLACLQFMSEYGGLGIIIIIWLTLTVGGLLCLLSGVFLLFSKAERQIWKKTMLVGLWLLLVSGGSCGLLLGGALMVF